MGGGETSGEEATSPAGGREVPLSRETRPSGRRKKGNSERHNCIRKGVSETSKARGGHPVGGYLRIQTTSTIRQQPEAPPRKGGLKSYNSNARKKRYKGAGNCQYQKRLRKEPKRRSSTNEEKNLRRKKKVRD